MENSDTCDNGKVNEYFLYDIVEEEFSKYYENLVLSRDNHPDIPQEAYHLCRICNSKYDTFDKLNCHSLHHFIERKYHCRKCLFYGRSIKSLGDHAKKIHTNNPYIRCPYCGRSFNILDHLPFESHIKTHFQYKNQLEMMGARNLRRMLFICMTCGKVFWHKNQLTDHVAAEKNVRESTEPLSSSRGQPLTPQTLAKHKKTIAENSWKCNICGETFATKNKYSEHFNICKAEFVRRSKRSRPPKFARKVRKTPDDGISERFKTVKIVCAVCNETCTLNRQLRRHIRMGHVEFLYICKTCGHVAKNEKSMMKHSQNHINLLDLKEDFSTTIDRLIGDLIEPHKIKKEIDDTSMEIMEINNTKMEIEDIKKEPEDDDQNLESSLDISKTTIKTEIVDIKSSFNEYQSNVFIKKEPFD